MVMEANKWKEADFPWQKVMQGYIQHNVKIPFFDIGFTPDSKNSSIKRIGVREIYCQNLLSHRKVYIYICIHGKSSLVNFTEHFVEKFF